MFVFCRKKDALQPQFPPDIVPQTCDRAVQYLKDTIGMDITFCLSCDDTKLLPKFSTYWDNSKNAYVLVGGTETPHLILDKDELDKIITEGSQKKATKVRLNGEELILFRIISAYIQLELQVRLWCLQPSSPKVPPIIIAVKALPESVDADILYEWLIAILQGLIEQALW